MNPKVLLLQARHSDDPMAEHEHECFVRGTGLAREDVALHDLCQGPPSTEQVESYDALMVGGSGDFYVSKGNLPDWDRFLDFLREIVERKHPMFASCFGYQSMVAALGGEIIHDPENTEVGTYELQRNDDAHGDPLFGDMPAAFLAQMGHKDRAARHPAGLPNFASSAVCPYQAFRVPDAPIWASQFHPELDRETNQDRFRHYLEGYARFMSDAERDEALARFKESPEASALLRRFLDVVFG